MPAYRFKGMTPVVDPSSFVHPLASLIGDVIVGPRCYIAAGASLRGDFGRIQVDGESSIQDNVTLHSSAETDCHVERGATIGHGAILHGCHIGEDALIGMGAIVLDGARIGAECLVAAQAFVRAGAQFPNRQLIAGNPARAIKEFSAEQVGWRSGPDAEYVRLAAACLADFEECAPLAAPEADRARIRSSATPVRLLRPAPLTQPAAGESNAPQTPSGRVSGE
ncbi:MAG: hypothetical protein NW206_10145 [Hyphomonadaceae bacterium]|nr:hypothetical protein [Hyphomonadaceae bacterium]